jgi:prophage regulatory protein
MPWAEMRRRVPDTNQHLKRLEKADKFPQRVWLGENRIARIESEYEDWVSTLAAERGRKVG